MKTTLFATLLVIGLILFFTTNLVAAMPKAGDVALPFEGQDQDGNTVKLADFAGKKIVLLFLPIGGRFNPI